MTTAVQHRRGTTAEHATFTGLEGEVTIDTTKDTAVIHDGTLAGGYPLAKENLANVNPTTLSTIDGASTASDDKFLIWDQSALTLKSITRAELNNAMEADVLASVTITGGTINGTTIGGTTPALITGTTITATSGFSGNLTGNVTGDVSGNAGTVTNGLYSTGSYSNPAWITSLAGSKISGDISGNAATATTATNVSGGTASVTTLSASGAVTLSGGTANSVPYLNGSKVLTTGGALTFDGTNLSVVGNSASAIQSVIRNDNATANAGGILKFKFGSTDTGYLWNYFDGADFITALYAPKAVLWNIGSAGGSEQMRLTSTGLGIGTSSPGYKLDVRGEGFVGTAVNSGIRMVNAGGINYLQSGNSGAAASLHIGNWYGNGFAVLDSSGNLGLGVTPSAWSRKAFQIEAGGSAAYLAASGGTMVLGTNVRYNSGDYYIGNGNAAYYAVQADGKHVWATAPSGTAGNAISFTQAMTLDASGNLGIGTSSPFYKLDVAGAARSESWIGRSNSSAPTADCAVYRPADNSIGFSTANTERARIDSSGNWLVGTTSVIGSSTTQYTGTAQPVVAAFASNAGFTNAVVLARMAGTSTSAQLFIGQNATNTAVFYARGDGAIFSTSTSITSLSDRSLKTNIRDLETGLSEVMALKPKRFDWLNGEGQNTKDVAGFIAQDVESVLPDLVSDYEYKPASDGLAAVLKKSLKMGDMLPTLVKAIQEQQAIIDQLKARLDAANL